MTEMIVLENIRSLACFLSGVRPGRLLSSNNYLVGCYGKSPFERELFLKKMKRSGDELNLSEGERGSKSRKTLNFVLADRDGIEGNASSSSSISDVPVSETAREKLKRKLLQKKDCKDDGTEILESWLREILAVSLVGEILDLTFEHSPFESLDELPLLTVCSCCIHLKNTPTTTRQDHSGLFDLLSMLTALGVYSVQCMNM